ncbi:2-oxo acid dehydrogenase subunit E2 [Spiroplasma chrysopicola]|uniref:Dihydrolipoamide acetyltransferase component of pyruvate dehydrogenase complex n=1 Tax=Spiroplasma chrysopicola DF-1 TaxID=1276227 RepID=R4UHQ0_9MOLU|nr:2-oxo acid dehydrogenase subunit E2 [Spiroplasma chrysopicola]AGM24856.1 hypothetical protein SCHRY_v1c02710 [Spiroplasma chrysopicola DF-1]
MGKIFFEADDNRKGIIDNVFVKEGQPVQTGDKLVNVVTQSRVYEIKAPGPGVVTNLSIYENKVINTGDILLELNSQSKHYNHHDQKNIYNKSNFTNVRFDNNQNKKTETEIFREELIETLLARKVAGENSDSIELTEEILEPVLTEQPTVPLSQQTGSVQSEVNNNTYSFGDEIATTSVLLTDEVNNTSQPAADEKDFISNMNSLRKNLQEVETATNTVDIQEEIINNLISDVDVDQLSGHSNFKPQQPFQDELSKTFVHRMYTDIQNDLNHESNIEPGKVEIEPTTTEIIYFNEELMEQELDDNNIVSTPTKEDPSALAPEQPSFDQSEIIADLTNNVEEPRDISQENNDNISSEATLSAHAYRRVERLLKNHNKTAQTFLDIEVDVSELVSLLTIMREAYLQQNIELTLLPFFVKAVHSGLKKFPLLNASFNLATQSVLFKWIYNIAVSLDNDTTITTPVLFDLKDDTIKEIATKCNALAAKEYDDNSEAFDYENSTFSIFNFGDFGVTRGTLTIPEHHSAAIGMGIIFKKPVVVEKNDIAIRDIMVITLAYNEMIIDITEASKFAHYVAYLLSNPGLLL